MSVHIPSRPQAPTPAAGTLTRSSGASKAGPIGPGAGVLMTEYHLGTALPTDPSKRMRSAWKIGESVAYVFAAERVISGKIAGMGPVEQSADTPVGWHLEDPDGVTIDDTYPAEAAREAYQVLEKPMAALSLDEAGGMRQTRRMQWELTSRHAGLCGTAFWVLDQLNGWGFPRAILYCRPDRMTPEPNAQGGLKEWRLDRGKIGNPDGTPVSVDEVVPFYLQAPNEGFLATGLVDAALVKAQLNGGIDRYFAQVIGGGGRLSGIIAPKQGAIEDENTYQQLLRDWRNVTEQPEAAKRLQVVRAPIEFTKTVNTPAEMGLIELMARNRDDLLAIWGVPYSQVGGSPAAGLGQGEARDQDRQALWENAIYPRLAMMQEPIQELLDRLAPMLGWAPRFVLDLPRFEDGGYRFDKLAKSERVLITNDERRAMIGLEPFPPEVIGSSGGPLGQEIWVPLTVQPVATAEPGRSIERPVLGETGAEEQEDEDEQDAEEPDVASEEVGAAAKARLPSMRTLRATVERRVTPVLQKALVRLLAEQRDDIAGRVEKQWGRITRHPSDEQAWWSSRWDKQMERTMRPVLAGVGELVGETVEATMGGARKASVPEVSKRAAEHVLTRGVARVVGINATTRKGLRRIIDQAVTDGLSPREAGDRIREWTGFDTYRAERIARTELMNAYNAAALRSYGEYDVTHVEAIDGHDDPECAERNGKTFTLLDAESITDHPNGTLDWIPVT